MAIEVIMIFYNLTMVALVASILRYYHMYNKSYKKEFKFELKSLDIKLKDNCKRLSKFNESMSIIVDTIYTFSNSISCIEDSISRLKTSVLELNEVLNNVCDKVNILEDELSNNIRSKLYKIVINSTKGFNIQLEPEKIFISYLLDKNINDISDAFGKLIRNIELINDSNFKVSLLGNSKSYLTSLIIGIDIENNFCTFPQKLIDELIVIQEEGFSNFVENLKLSLSLKKEEKLKELALIHLYKEFQDYIDKAVICFENNNEEIKDVNYLKTRHYDSKYLKKENNIVNITKEEVNKDYLLNFLTKGNEGLKKVLSFLRGIEDLDNEIKKNVIILSNSFYRYYNDKAIGIDVKDTEINKIVQSLTDLIQENL